MPRTALVALLAAAVAAPAAAYAADQLVPGKRLLVVNTLPDREDRNRIILTARSADLAIAPPGSAGDPTCAGAGGGGARLTVRSTATGESHTTELPCQNWTGRKTGSWRYADREMDDGTCKTVQIRSTRTVRALCYGRGPTTLDFDLQEGTPQPPIDVTLELGAGPGAERYCLRFGGVVKNDGSNGKQFFARDSAAPTACAPAVP
jgi:hypothetical protein